MGAHPSKPTAAEKAIIDRLRTLDLEKKEAANDDGYVEVDEFVSSGSLNEKTLDALRRSPTNLDVSQLEDWQAKLLDDPKNRYQTQRLQFMLKKATQLTRYPYGRLALSALSAANPRDVLTSRAAKISDQQVYNIKIPFEGAPITNQRSSGRCWLFAATNVFRVALMQRYNLESFELSQSWLFFWDKLEKANYFLEQIIDTADEELDSRLVQTLVQAPLSDGGQWDMVYNLIAKYGLVPQVLYPDSFNAMSSSIINSIIFTKLREDALILRGLLKSPTATSSSVAAAKAKMVKEIHTILTLTLGPPPAASEEFTWQYVDKSGKAREVVTTPIDFAADIWSSEYRVTSSVIAGLVSLVHDPRNPPLSLLTVDRLGNIVGGRGITYINVEMQTLKNACVSMLKAGLPVFFGSDVGKFSDRVSGVMDVELIDYELGFNVSLLGMDKASRLRTGESASKHNFCLFTAPPPPPPSSSRTYQNTSPGDL